MDNYWNTPENYLMALFGMKIVSYNVISQMNQTNSFKKRNTIKYFCKHIIHILKNLNKRKLTIIFFVFII